MPSSADTADSSGAVLAEVLYLANLLLAPGLAFVLLAMRWRRRAEQAPLTRAHLEQAFAASLWAGALLVLANGAILLLGGWHGPHVWLVVIIYFTACHSWLVLLGVYGLAKAMAGQMWRYPLIGPALPDTQEAAG